jgi:hypothetical protein
LKPNAPLSLRTIRTRGSNDQPVQELAFTAFKARNTFPNNILLLKDNELVTFDNGEERNQFDFVLRGRVLNKKPFDDVEGVFTFTFKKRTTERREYNASEVVNKCSIAPLTKSPKYVGGSSIKEDDRFEYMALTMIA